MEAIMGSVMAHIIDHDFVYLRRLLSTVCRSFRLKISELSKLTEHQKSLLTRLMALNSMESIPAFPCKVKSEHIVHFPAASGGTRTMLLAALKLSYTNKRPVVVVANPELFPKMTNTITSLISEFQLPPAQTAERFQLSKVDTKKNGSIVCFLCVKNFSPQLFFELCQMNICAIFVDGYVGKQYPKFSRDLVIWWNMKNIPLPGFAILDTTDTSVVDKQIQLPKLLPVLHLVKSCAFCIDGDCNARSVCRLNLEVVPFLTKHLKDKKKVLILHQLSRNLLVEHCQKSFGFYFESLVRAAQLPPLLYYGAGAQIGTEIATFNKWEQATLALPWNPRILSGHDILADAVVLFNGRSPHTGRDPVPPSPRIVSELMHCVRRPTNKNAEIPVCIVDFSTKCLELLSTGYNIENTKVNFT